MMPRYMSTVDTRFQKVIRTVKWVSAIPPAGRIMEPLQPHGDNGRYCQTV